MKRGYGLSCRRAYLGGAGSYNQQNESRSPRSPNLTESAGQAAHDISAMCRFVGPPRRHDVARCSHEKAVALVEGAGPEGNVWAEQVEPLESTNKKHRQNADENAAGADRDDRSE